MSKRKVILSSPDFIYFNDIDNPEHLYCVTEDEHTALLKILTKGKSEQDMPHNKTIKAYRLRIVDAQSRVDYYDIIDKTLIDFPIFRIDWVFVYGSRV